jgi:signal transduction histidine kinase
VNSETQQLSAFVALSRLMHAGVVVVSPERRLDFASDRAADLFACASIEELRRAWPEIVRALPFDLGSLRSPPEWVYGTADISGPRGNRFLRLQVQLLAPPGGGYLILASDRRELGAEDTDVLLASQMRTLPHAYRLLAHDLKAPLNAMQLTLELLTDGPAAASADAARDARRQRYLSVLREELTRLDRMLQASLVQYEPLKDRVSAFDLRDVMREGIALITPQARRQRVSLDVQVPNEAVSVDGSRDRLKQAILNIALSGLDAMPEGGRLDWKLAAEGNSALLTCEDTRGGLDESEVAAVYQVGGIRRAGVGSELYVARLVAESHGGDLRLEVRQQVVRIGLRLPLSSPPA